MLACTWTRGAAGAAVHLRVRPWLRLQAARTSAAALRELPPTPARHSARPTRLFHLFIKIPPVSEPPEGPAHIGPRAVPSCEGCSRPSHDGRRGGETLPWARQQPKFTCKKTQRSKTATRRVFSPGDGAAPGSAGTGRAVLRPPGPTGTGSAQQPHSHVPQPGPLSGCGYARTGGAWRGSACRHAQVWAGRSVAAQRCAASSGRRRSAERAAPSKTTALQPRTRPSPPLSPYLPTTAAVVAAAQQGEGSTAGRAVAAAAVRHPLGPSVRSCWGNVKGKATGGLPGVPAPVRAQPPSWHRPPAPLPLTCPLEPGGISGAGAQGAVIHVGHITCIQLAVLILCGDKVIYLSEPGQGSAPRVSPWVGHVACHGCQHPQLGTVAMLSPRCYHSPISPGTGGAMPRASPVTHYCRLSLLRFLLVRLRS